MLIISERKMLIDHKQYKHIKESLLCSECGEYKPSFKISAQMQIICNKCPAGNKGTEFFYLKQFLNQIILECPNKDCSKLVSIPEVGSKCDHPAKILDEFDTSPIKPKNIELIKVALKLQLESKPKVTGKLIWSQDKNFARIKNLEELKAFRKDSLPESFFIPVVEKADSVFDKISANLNLKTSSYVVLENPQNKKLFSKIFEEANDILLYIEYIRFFFATILENDPSIKSQKYEPRYFPFFENHVNFSEISKHYFTDMEFVFHKMLQTFSFNLNISETLKFDYNFSRMMSPGFESEYQFGHININKKNLKPNQSQEESLQFEDDLFPGVKHTKKNIFFEGIIRTGCGFNLTKQGFLFANFRDFIVEGKCILFGFNKWNYFGFLDVRGRKNGIGFEYNTAKHQILVGRYSKGIKTKQFQIFKVDLRNVSVEVDFASEDSKRSNNGQADKEKQLVINSGINTGTLFRI